MISKANTVLTFEKKFFQKNNYNINRPDRLKQHETFGGVLSYDNMRDFFGHAQEVKGCDF